jgi:hypothetical protein
MKRGNVCKGISTPKKVRSTKNRVRRLCSSVVGIKLSSYEGMKASLVVAQPAQPLSVGSYLVTTADNVRLLWVGRTEVEGTLTWLCRDGKRLWSVPNGAIKQIDRVEYLVHVANGAKRI